MEGVRLETYGCQLSVGDLDALWILALIEFGADLEAGVCGGCGDELDNCAVAAERLAPPVYRDEREQPVLDLVPLCAAETYERRSDDLTIIWKLFER